MLLAVSSGTNLQIEVLGSGGLSITRESFKLDSTNILELDDQRGLVDEGQGPLQGI